MTRLYLAGPMTGYPEWNFPAFRAAAEELRASGFEVVNPAELDEEAGFDPKAPAAEFTDEHLREALKRDVIAVLDSDGVATLPGWQKSRGACAEVSLAYAAKRPARDVRVWLQMAKDGQA